MYRLSTSFALGSAGGHVPLANGRATCVTARATAVAGGAGWKCCGKSFRYSRLKVDWTMGDLSLVPTPPQKFSYALYRPCCMRLPFRLLLTKSFYRKGPESHRKEEVSFSLSQRVVFPFACSDFPIQHLVSFYFCTPWGKPCHQPARRYRSNLSEKYQPKLWAFGVGQSPTTNLKFGFFW